MEQNKRSNRNILLVLFVGVLMGALDISIVGPAIPSISKDIAVSQRLLGWIFSIYVLFNLVGISLFAKLSDRFGRRSIYMLSVFLFAIGSLIVALSHTFDMLMLGRAVQGFGSSGIFPVASAVVGDVFPPEKRGRILGLIGAVFGLAFIIGPVIAGTMLSFFSWNYLFLINLPIAALIMWGSFRILPNKRIESSTVLDWKGIVLLGLLLGAFALGINRTSTSGFFSSLASMRVLPFLVASVALLFVFVRIEKDAQNPVVRVNMFRSRQIRLVALIAFGTGVLQASFVFVPDFVVDVFGVTSAKASFMLLPAVLAIAVGSPLFGRMLDAVGSRVVILIGLVIAIVGYYLMHEVEGSRSFFYLAGALIGLGLSVPSGSSLRYIMLNEVSAAERATTQGLVTIFISIGQMLGGAIIGAITASEEGIKGYQNLFFYLAVMILVMTLFSVRLKSRKVELATSVRE